MNRSERLGRRWARRAVTLPAVFLGLTIWLACLPFLVLLAGVVDLVAGGKYTVVRFVLAVAWVLGSEVVGVLASGLFWLRRQTGWSEVAWLHAHYRFQAAWLSGMLHAAAWLFRMRIRVEGAELAAAGPVLMLVRHASVFDTLLPAALVSRPYGLRLRYVIKRELLWDPCLDIVGQRLPNAFIRRRSLDPGYQVAAVGSLGRGLGVHDGALIFPEGTRFSARRQAQLREASTGPAALTEAARELQHVLPPRIGGVQALLEAAPDADVVVCAHTGFERVRRVSDMWTGGLWNREIGVRFWRIPRAEVPDEPEARKAWLLAQWREVDAYVGDQR